MHFENVFHFKEEVSIMNWVNEMPSNSICSKITSATFDSFAIEHTVCRQNLKILKLLHANRFSLIFFFLSTLVAIPKTPRLNNLMSGSYFRAYNSVQVMKSVIIKATYYKAVSIS